MQDVTQHYAKILHNTEQDSTTLDNVTRTIFGKGGEKYFELLIKKFKPNTEIVSLGDSGCRVNPCPACGHNDCFTFNPENCVYNCFGCGVKGNVMNIAKHFTSDLTEAGQALKEFTGIDLLSLSSENQELIRKRKLFRDASEIYNKQLILNDTAYDYLIKVRRRKPETIDAMVTGFCADNKAFAEDLEQLGYSPEEIRSVYVPQGLFVYPYFDRYGFVTRFNTKNYLHTKDSTGKEISGYSIGKRQLLYSQGNYDEAVVVEGEQDFSALLENGVKNVVATGGGPTNEQIESLRQFKRLYLCFDNDEGGKGFTQKVNEALPDISVKCLHIPDQYKDIDEYYRETSYPLPFNELLKSAEELQNTECYAFVKNGTVYLKNRSWRAEFEISEFSANKKRYKGNLSYYLDDVLKDSKSAIIMPDGLPKNLIAYSDKFLDAIEQNFNSGFETKTLRQLDDIYHLTVIKTEAVSAAAKRLFEIKDKKMRDTELASLGNMKFKSRVSEELIALDNANIKVDVANVPVLNPCQAYVIGPEESIAYFYFNRIEQNSKGKHDEVPYLLTSDKRLIKLTDFVRETPNEMLIVDGRFRLKNMVKGVLLETQNVSLKQEYAEKYIKGDIPPEYLTPKYIVQSFEALFPKICYSSDPALYKVLASFCYTTYFADLTGVMPYLFLTAQKGAGKSTVMALCSDLCFNAQFVTDCSAASFLRISNLCSTLIMDEFESHSSRSKNAEDDIIPLIKAGYSKSSAGATRTNPDEFYKVDYYDVYSPKIFGSIGEIDDVLRDRSLTIILKKFTADEIKGTMDTQVFKNLYAAETIRLRSLAALSALAHFREVYDAFCDTKLKFKSARSNQIFHPLYTLAGIVGEEYIKALDVYCAKSLQSSDYMDSQSTEGGINYVIRLLLQGWLKDSDLSNCGIVHDLIYDEKTDRYSLGAEVMRFSDVISKRIKIDGNIICFNTADLTYMANQLHDYGKISLHSVHTALHRIFSSSEYERSTVTFNDDDIIKFFENKRSFSCFKIKLDVSKYGYDKIKQKMYDDETKDLTERMEKRKDHVDEDIYSLPLGQPPITAA